MNKKVPLRMCVGCHEMKPKKTLARVVKNKDAEIAVDLIGKMQGRGAYVCRNHDCLNKAIKTKKLERAFDCVIPTEVYEKLKIQMEEIND
ncbi:MAG: YlxR family protein [Clostridia bacterium]